MEWQRLGLSDSLLPFTEVIPVERGADDESKLCGYFVNIFVPTLQASWNFIAFPHFFLSFSSDKAFWTQKLLYRRNVIKW